MLSGIGVLQLYDLTFLLLDADGKMIMAVSYKDNAANLLQLISTLNLKKLYFVAHPYPNETGLIHIPEWDRNKVSFGLLLDDIKVINEFFMKSNASEGYLVNALDGYENLTRLASYNTVRSWCDHYAFVSMFNHTLTEFKLYDSINELLDNCSKGVALSNESMVLDITKVKALHPELLEIKQSEAVLLGATLNAVNSKTPVVLPMAIDDMFSQSFNVERTAKANTIVSEQLAEETPSVEQPIEEPIEKPKKQKEKVDKKPKKKGSGKLLTVGIFVLSLLIGASVGTKSVDKHIEAMRVEAGLVSNEIAANKKNEEFYVGQASMLSGENEEMYEIYSGIKGIKVNGLLYSFTSANNQITLVYYLLDDSSLTTLQNALGAKYTVQSVSQTDTLTVQNRAINVYTITLTL